MKKKKTSKKKEKKLSELLRDRESRFYLINVLAKRARALINGASPLVKPDDLILTSDAAHISLLELKNDKLKATQKKGKEKLVNIVKTD